MADEIENTSDKTELELLQEELSDKWDAKIDNAYVDYDGRGHLFEYDLNFNKFLSNISTILGMKK